MADQKEVFVNLVHPSPAIYNGKPRKFEVGHAVRLMSMGNNGGWTWATDKDKKAAEAWQKQQEA